MKTEAVQKVPLTTIGVDVGWVGVGADIDCVGIGVGVGVEVGKFHGHSSHQQCYWGH